MCDGTGLAEAMLGLAGFRVLGVEETCAGELTVAVETTTTLAGCGRSGVRAEPQDRMPVRTGIWSVSVDRSAWCGTSSGGAAESWTVTPRRGPSAMTGSLIERC